MVITHPVNALGRRLGLWGAGVGLGLSVLTGSNVLAQGGGPTFVVLVRHAEKAAEPGDDPPISEAGQARARALAAALSHTRVTAVIASIRRRTTETAQPLTAARHLTPQIIGMDGGTEAHVASVAAAVRRQAGGVVLVVGHSNTVPAVIAALGGPKLPDLCDASYATMFVLELPAGAGASGAGIASPRLVRAQYGAADPPGADTCPGMIATPPSTSPQNTPASRP